MIFRNLDSDGDWTFGKGRNDYVSETEAIGLNIRTRIMSWLGDCFFSINSGIDWYNRLGSTNQKELLEMDLRATILQSFGVTAIKDFAVTVTGRQFNAEYSIQTIYGKEFKDTIILGV